jgi:hypothetical protein
MRKLATRTRLHAVGFAAAFAFLVGLAGPAAASVGRSTEATPAEQSGVTAALVAAAIGEPAAAEAATEAKPAEAPATPPAEAAPVAAPAPAPAPAAPSAAELHPAGVTADQTRFTPTAEQLSNAKAIVEAGKAMGLPPRAWVIAIATSLQESQLKNIGNLGAANDHDSLGLFQQRPSSGWGTPEQIQDPIYSATAFYKGLVGVDGWQSLPLTSAAQKVQVSAYPDHYAKHEAQAGDIVNALYGTGPYAEIAKTV